MKSLLSLASHAGLVLGVALFSSCARPRVSVDAQFQQLAEEYLAGHLAWRPTVGMALGLHQYDGRITSFSRASMDSEIRRLKRFDALLASIDRQQLTSEAQFDYRLLQSTIRAELFSFNDVKSYTRNPMTYAQAMDLTQYVKRDFAPLT